MYGSQTSQFIVALSYAAQMVEFIMKGQSWFQYPLDCA